MIAHNGPKSNLFFLVGQGLFDDLAVSHEPGEARQPFGDAVLLVGLAPDPPAHPALGGDPDRILQVGGVVQFVQLILGKVPTVAAVEEGA